MLKKTLGKALGVGAVMLALVGFTLVTSPGGAKAQTTSNGNTGNSSTGNNSISSGSSASNNGSSSSISPNNTQNNPGNSAGPSGSDSNFQGQNMAPQNNFQSPGNGGPSDNGQNNGSGSVQGPNQPGEPGNTTQEQSSRMPDNYPPQPGYNNGFEGQSYNEGNFGAGIGIGGSYPGALGYQSYMFGINSPTMGIGVGPNIMSPLSPCNTGYNTVYNGCNMGYGTDFFNSYYSNPTVTYKQDLFSPYGMAPLTNGLYTNGLYFNNWLR